MGDFNRPVTGMNDNDIGKTMHDFQEYSGYHAKAIQEVIDTQLDREAAAQLNDSGGGRMVLNAVISILDKYISLEKANASG